VNRTLWASKCDTLIDLSRVDFAYWIYEDDKDQLIVHLQDSPSAIKLPEEAGKELVQVLKSARSWSPYIPPSSTGEEEFGGEDTRAGMEIDQALAFNPSPGYYNLPGIKHARGSR
jgi:hypothetical protein